MILLLPLGSVAVFVLLVSGWRLARDPGVAIPDGYGDVLRAAPERSSLLGKLLRLLDRVVGGRVVSSLSTGSRRKVEAALMSAGRSESSSYENVVSRQATWAFLMACLAFFLLSEGFVWAVVLPVLGWYFPRISLWLAGRRRSALIERELPDFLDVIAVTISAGLEFRGALQRVSVLVGGAVGEEMLIALRQIEVGSSRRAAFSAMRDRTGSKALVAFVTSFLQAEELGAPISDFLIDYAAELRRGAAQRARTQASKANPKISLVLTLVIMPALVIFLIGSIIIQATQA